MHRTSPVILLVQEPDMASVRIVAELAHALPECRVLHAASVVAAQTLSISVPLAIVLADTSTGDGEVLRFLGDVKLIHPEVAVVVMAAAEAREGAARARERAGAGMSEGGHFAVLEKPVNTESLVRVLQRALQASVHLGSTSPELEDGFEAILRALSPIDIIQMTCLRGSTSVLEFVSVSGIGHVRVVSGEIVHAATGELIGVEALNEIVGWKGGRVCEVSEPCVVMPTIHGHWQTLLMHAAHSIDQSQACEVG